MKGLGWRPGWRPPATGVPVNSSYSVVPFIRKHIQGILGTFVFSSLISVILFMPSDKHDTTVLIMSQDTSVF